MENDAMPEGNTSVPLKEHIEARLDAMEKAVIVANKAMQERLAGMNEFRETLRDQTAKYPTRDEMNARLDVICSQMESIEKDLTTKYNALRDQVFKSITREEYDLKHEQIESEIKSLEISKATMEGKASMSSVYIAYGVSFIGLLLTIIDFIRKLP